MTVNVRDEIVWLTRGRNWGYRFLSLGPLRSKDEAIRVRDSVFANIERESSKAVRGKIRLEDGVLYFYYAQVLRDPEMRDASGRFITHEIIMFKAESLCFSPNVVAVNFCTAIKDYYQSVFNKATTSNLSQDVKVEIPEADSCIIHNRDVSIVKYHGETDANIARKHSCKYVCILTFGALILMSVIHFLPQHSAVLNAELGGVQLGEGGSYCAECSVGVNNSEEYGYYFWWGDTIGCKWSLSDRCWAFVNIVEPFSYSTDKCPIGRKHNSELRSAECIDSFGNSIGPWSHRIHSRGIYRCGEECYLGQPIRVIQESAK